MTTRSFPLLLLLLIVVCGQSCKEETGCTDPDSLNFSPEATSDDGSCEYGPRLIFKMKFDPNQERLDNGGQPATLPAGHAAQTPAFNLMGIHYIELSRKHDIPAYNGFQVYKSPTTSAGGSEAIDFDQAIYAEEAEEYFTLNLADIPPGTYKYLRMSLSYQNFTINFRASGLDLQGTLASFVGSNTYIREYTINDEVITVNANKAQGYWAFATDFPGVPVLQGQAPAGATTVPNPLAATSAIPPGSCLVTGIFDTPLVVTGNETEDIRLVTSISVNNSFEWVDPDGNGTYDPQDGDQVVDMGVRGLIPMVE